ncbi:DNA polymerase III subunit gamma and tau [Bifidobacterium sp. 82T24]|uniref:DNA polymerase III subunit gamma and tau n=1 Tax=Bifidobacterium pluvialisilvae TaxID=2834436 RepID=UPI001C5957EF|nr:DNA polymerase III subunit gamma and tau [Bifidobacterium pluvialisilvae]MBW3088296.1 DNA polymerase III subunit gamma and tau [Bifidobacterium pluvialisilvae]
MALALYRRYRPDTFDGVIGQDQVTIPLSRALDEGKLTHAYLFSGPRGCGKTSSARILARCVNCAKGPTSHPCGECESCRDLATGGPGSIDVVEIDAASHNGVDDARELRERAGFAPARDRYKIFILDEAHMVTQQGFNALLKIVEEPPEHVMFIFATTEPEKVIGTIRSRTHHYPFRLVPPEVMGPYLEEICGKEGIKPEPGVLRLAMRAGGGSMRDTLSVLDQLMVGAVDNVITHDAAIALLGFTPDALISEAVDAVIDADGEKLYGVVQKVVVGGFDPRRFVEDLLSRVRDLLVLTIAGERAESVLSDDAEAEDIDDLRRQSKALGLERLTSIADVINSTLGSMSGATSPRMRLELLAARLLVPFRSSQTTTTPAASAETPVAPAAAPQQSGAARGGFIGRRRTQQAPQPGAESPAASKPAAPASAHAPVAPAPAAQAPTEQQAPTQADKTTPSPDAEQHPADDTRTPDEKWDALVAALPQDVRQYVDRTKVPRVKLAPHPKTGKVYLWIKFNKPLDKYAFALAMAEESVDGTTKVTDILRAETRKMFGPTVGLAPTKKMADGQESAPWKSLSPQQQQQIKAQLLQERMSAAAVSGTGTSAASQPREHDAATADASAASDDADVHRVGRAAASQAPAPLPDDDPWAAPAPATTPEKSPSSPDAPSSPADAAMPAASDDPWAVSAHPASSYEDLSHTEPHRGTPQGQTHTKHVAVPDLSDDTDPWAMPTAGDAPQQAATAPQQSSPAQQPPAQPQQMQHFHPNAQRTAAAPPRPAPGGPTPASAPQPAAPAVDPDEDEYSMTDASLGSSNAMSLDALKQMFEVKTVEDLAPDDPRNPRNIAAKRKTDADGDE